MKVRKLVTHAGLTVNLEQIKSLKLNKFTNVGKTNTLIVEFKTRYEYLKHPKTGEFEKQEFSEKSEIESSK